MLKGQAGPGAEPEVGRKAASLLLAPRLNPCQVAGRLWARSCPPYLTRAGCGDRAGAQDPGHLGRAALGSPELREVS